MEKIDRFDAAAYAAGAELLEELLDFLESEEEGVASIDIAVWSPEILESEPKAVIARIYDYRGDLLESSFLTHEEMSGLPVHRFLQSSYDCYPDSDLEKEVGFAVEVFCNIDVESLRNKIGDVLKG